MENQIKETVLCVLLCPFFLTPYLLLTCVIYRHIHTYKPVSIDVIGF